MSKQSKDRNKKVGGYKKFSAQKAFMKAVNKKLKAMESGRSGHTAVTRKILNK